MTTLADARRELHQLAARRDRLRLRIRRGELVPRRVVGNLAFVTGRRFRDAILAMPARHVPLLAADCGLPTGAFGVALTVALQIDLCGLAGRPPPQRRPPPPEPPIADPKVGYFESWVDNQWAAAWREKYPERAREQTAWEAAIIAYFRRWGILPRPGQAGYSAALHAGIARE